MNNIQEITVLIANYNNAKYLIGALRSVYEQTYPYWRVVICDDGSTDNSEDVYAEYVSDSRICVIRNVVNRGVAYTKWRLLKELKTELACFLDPDDELTPNALLDHLLVHQNHPEVSIVFSRRYLCDNQLNIIQESIFRQIPNGKSYFTMKDFREEHLVSFKQSYYIRTKGTDITYKRAVDADFNFMMEEVGKVYCLDKICYKYRRNGDSLTRDYGRHMFWNMLVQYDTCKRRGIDVEEQVYSWFEDTLRFVEKEEIYKAECRVRHSAAYRLGAVLLKPIKFIQNLVTKK